MDQTRTRGLQCMNHRPLEFWMSLPTRGKKRWTKRNEKIVVILLRTSDSVACLHYFCMRFFARCSHLVYVSLFYGVSAWVCAPRLMELHTTTKEECVHFNLFIVIIILLLLVARTPSHPQQPVCSSTSNVRSYICGIVSGASIRSCRNYEHQQKT